MSTPTATSYYLPDPLGSTANLVSSAGVTQWTYTYEPYGTVRSATNAQGAPTNLMRFNGQLIDTVDNLYDLRARMYDPGTGRFLQLDPLPDVIAAPRAGTYAYVRDRPTIAVDPSGLICWLFGLNYSDGGCIGGSTVNAVGRFASKYRWQIGTALAGAGCFAVPLLGCAAITTVYVAGQSAVLFEENGEQLSLGFVVNALCGAVKSIGSVVLKLPLESTVGLVTLPGVGPWYSSPGCWSASVGSSGK